MTTKAAKGKKGTIVAMIAETKAETVIAIIEKHQLNFEILLPKKTLTWQEIRDLLPKNVFLMPLVSQINLLIHYI